jgi:hypothetical protein
MSQRTRFEVFKRDGFRCQYCGHHPPDVLLEVDHVIPVAGGGTDDEENLLTACFNCNRGKGAVPLSAVPKSLGDKAAETAEREEQLAGYREIMQARADRIERDAWEIVEILFPPLPDGRLTIKRDWFRSIKIFNEKLPLHVTKDAAELARDRGPFNERRRFLYFCKLCWNKIKDGFDGG